MHGAITDDIRWLLETWDVQTTGQIKTELPIYGPAEISRALRWLRGQKEIRLIHVLGADHWSLVKKEK